MAGDTKPRMLPLADVQIRSEAMGSGKLTSSKVMIRSSTTVCLRPPKIPQTVLAQWGPYVNKGKGIGCGAHSREFRLFWPVLASSERATDRLRAATAHVVGRVLRFDAPAVVSREFRCVSMLPLWFRAISVAFRLRRSRCALARIPASSGLFWGGPLRLSPPLASSGPPHCFGVYAGIILLEKIILLLPLWGRIFCVFFGGFLSEQ